MRVLVNVASAAGNTREVELLIDPDLPPTSHTMEASPGASPVASAILSRFDLDQPGEGDVKTLGRHLFECLLGEANWTAILNAAAQRDADLVELALEWPSGEHDLNRLPWEAMHDGHDFIARHEKLCVAITRIVADADREKPPAPVAAPARVLFALSANMSDRRIRNGTEVIGLLRDAERGDGAIDPYVVDNASLRRLENACAQFKPDIVHIVSHGEELVDGRHVVELVGDAYHDGRANAEDLLSAFAKGGALPQLVLLTGCDSAASGEHMDSLAAALVKGGVPKAIGMAGKISDPVCRLFARRFGGALSAGEALVEAMAHGRRAGLRRQNAAAADDPSWALPSIYLAPSVPPDHAPVDATSQSAVLHRVGHYGLREDPVFCGRRQFVRLFDRLLDHEDELQVLMAYTENELPVGKTRMLHEFAGRALRAGHVVVMIDDDGDPTLPRTTMQLATTLLNEIVKTRQLFGLDVPPKSPLLDELVFVTQGPDFTAVPPEQLSTRLKGFLETCEGEIGGAALADALGKELVQLIADARMSDDSSVGDTSQAVVILGGLGKWDAAASVLLNTLLEPWGLGTPDESVPVFTVGSYSDAAGARLKQPEKLLGKQWARVQELGVFEDDEAVLASQWVLLHPRTTIDTKYSNLVYTPASGHESNWHAPLTPCLRGIPGNFDEDIFYATANGLTVVNVLAADDDLHHLELYTERLASERSGR